MQSRAATVTEYLAELPPERRKAIRELRKRIRANLDPAIREGMQYGMIGYFVPHSVYPQGYHCDPKQPLPFLSLASQKNHISLYLFCLYCDPQEVERFQREWRESGKRLDMGKACVRFKRIEDVPLEVVGDAIQRMSADRFIKAYEQSLGQDRKPASTRKRASGGNATKKTVKTSRKKKKKTAKKNVKKAAQMPAAKKRAPRTPEP